VRQLMTAHGQTIKEVASCLAFTQASATKALSTQSHQEAKARTAQKKETTANLHHTVSWPLIVIAHQYHQPVHTDICNNRKHTSLARSKGNKLPLFDPRCNRSSQLNPSVAHNHSHSHIQKPLSGGTHPAGVILLLFCSRSLSALRPQVSSPTAYLNHGSSSLRLVLLYTLNLSFTGEPIRAPCPIPLCARPTCTAAA
jgi:hypothetical protein